MIDVDGDMGVLVVKDESVLVVDWDRDSTGEVYYRGGM
jgi:hypothetical protein